MCFEDDGDGNVEMRVVKDVEMDVRGEGRWQSEVKFENNQLREKQREGMRHAGRHLIFPTRDYTTS
jgi:hypothetical protein